MDDNTPEFTDRQREFLNALPATSKEIANAMGIAPRSVRDHRENVQERGVELEYDEATHVWSRADDSGDLEEDTDTTLPEEPDPSDLTERERYILHQLQTATDTEELADDLGESPPV
ncbi:LuxR C-terminal-related transcriptional regulator, partial [uncultured Halorubrum sp.]|uniref:LuxR C-terminal-related transcriptional regulator n=1 Tax=uncultured Halorubrum sp. TaxID=399555 RepID=UPI00260D3A97